MQLIFAANAIILIKQAFLDVATKGVRTAQTHYNELQEAAVNSECGKLCFLFIADSNYLQQP